MSGIKDEARRTYGKVAKELRDVEEDGAVLERTIKSLRQKLTQAEADLVKNQKRAEALLGELESLGEGMAS